VLAGSIAEPSLAGRRGETAGADKVSGSHLSTVRHDSMRVRPPTRPLRSVLLRLRLLLLHQRRTSAYNVKGGARTGSTTTEDTIHIAKLTRAIGPPPRAHGAHGGKPDPRGQRLQGCSDAAGVRRRSAQAQETGAVCDMEESSDEPSGADDCGAQRGRGENPRAS
jgi:hypothetical protein